MKLNNPRDNMRFLILAVAICAIVFAVWGTYRVHHTPVLSLDPSQVEKIEAKQDIPGRETIVVDPADYGKVLSLFADFAVDHDPAKWQVLGSLLITFKDGQSRGILLYSTNQGAGAYSAKGIYYRGSTDAQIRNTLKGCYESVAGKK